MAQLDRQQGSSSSHNRFLLDPGARIFDQNFLGSPPPPPLVHSIVSSIACSFLLFPFLPLRLLLPAVATPDARQARQTDRAELQTLLTGLTCNNNFWNFDQSMPVCSVVGLSVKLVIGCRRKEEKDYQQVCTLEAFLVCHFTFSFQAFLSHTSQTSHVMVLSYNGK